MENDLHKKIEERLAELPEDVQAAIASSEYDEKIHAIGQAQGLHIDQMEALSDEVMLAMLGFVSMEDLAHGIEHQARVTSVQAQTMTDAVSHDIFLPIRESMKAWAASKTIGGSTIPPSVAPASMPAPSPSVVMPSSPKPTVPPVLTPASAPIATPKAPSAPIAAPSIPAVHDLVAADTMLSEKKVTPPAPAAVPAVSATPASNPTPATDPAQPQNYKADPYREPVG